MYATIKLVAVSSRTTSRRTNVVGKLKPLEIARLTKSGKYADGEAFISRSP
jgi:hypothetical protein